MIPKCGEDGRPCILCVKGKNPWNRDGKISLWCASEFGCDANVRRALADGGKANRRNGSGKTPLCWAASRGFVETMRILIDQGRADVNLSASKGQRSFTPLHYAAEKGHTRAVELLVARGADLNAGEGSGWTALHTAAYNCSKGYQLHQGKPFCYECGHVSTVERLLEAGATVDIQSAKGRTPLHQACMFNQHEIVKVLLDHGADPYVQDNERLTPKSIARGGSEICALITSHSEESE